MRFPCVEQRGQPEPGAGFMICRQRQTNASHCSINPVSLGKLVNKPRGQSSGEAANAAPCKPFSARACVCACTFTSFCENDASPCWDLARGLREKRLSRGRKTLPPRVQERNRERRRRRKTRSRFFIQLQMMWPTTDRGRKTTFHLSIPPPCSFSSNAASAVKWNTQNKSSKWSSWTSLL